MSNLLQIYGLTIVATSLLASGLALLGVQLAARDRAMQTLCLGQGAMLGVLLGLGLLQSFFSEHWLLDWPFLPLVTAVVSTVLSFVVSERLVPRGIASGNTHFVSFFAFLLAAGYLVSAIFPALESHMAQKYFGDVATLSQTESWLSLIFGGVLLMLMAGLSRSFSSQSFAKAIEGQQQSKALMSFSLFDAVSVFTLCYCVQTVGYLFTVACLFIPTAVASRTLSAGLRRHLVFCLAVAFIASVLGFGLSLRSNLPTVPTIIVVMLGLGIGLAKVLGTVKRLAQSRS